MMKTMREKLEPLEKALLTTVVAAALVVPLVAVALTGQKLWAQAPTIQSPAAPAPVTQSLEEMEAAGVKMSFDVASVKLNKAGCCNHSNVPLSSGAGFAPTGGLFSATNFPLMG